MDDLVKWLRVQLDEDERLAELAMQGPWQLHRIASDGAWQINGTSGTRSVARIPNSGQNEGTVQHIARHNPARVLAEVDAKRRILDQYEDVKRRAIGGYDVVDYVEDALDQVVSRLAVVYADRPGYRDEWKP